ncbi:tetratricopeptide repeat-containing sensor histidine kinase [Aquimarina sp. 2201CG14-23]|uniref:tetratricopeptide repeat-containing sensor histidine kinase n=1 Tax=Aquimarina mycalae TaxID=3040073 RepID=UPI0024782BAD|nr:tetratricopeptide repeat-containing sensor histidine kinase [Aquimarina sp. 2201CG14-23]MDH7444212.1 tetratricopeptide repeat-containing sensor histidine kinase [Aquimarina sp. 2201CG14-23]
MQKVFLFIGTVFFLGQTFAQDNIAVNPQSFNHITDTLQFKEALVALNKLIKDNQVDEVENLANVLIKKGEELNYSNGLGELYLIQGRFLKRNKKYLEAIRNYEYAEKNYKKANNLKGLANVFNTRSILESHRGNTEKSIDYLLEAKMYNEKLRDSAGLAIIYNNLASHYAGLDDLDESERYFNKAITTRKKIGMLRNIGMVMNNLAFIYLQNGKPDMARAMLPEALSINKKDSINASIAHSYSIMAEVELYEKDYEKAKKHYETSLSISVNTNYDLLTVDNKQQLGYLAIISKNYKEAEKLLAVARKESSDLGAVQLLMKNYQFSSKLDSTRGNLSGALAWQKKHQKLSDEMMTELSTKKMERAEARYQAELEHLRTIDAQEKREQLTREELFRYRVLTFVALGLLLIFFVFMVMIIRTRKERKRLISKLNESNQIKNKLFSIISHDLKNEIHGLEGSLNLMKEDAISAEEFKEIVPLLANRTHQTSILLNNLLNWSKSQMKELNARPITFDITEVISNKFAFFRPKASQKNIRLINRLDATNIFADKDMVSIVAQNLIANAIKFCNPGDSIALVSREKEDHYEICFEDTGVGIDPSNLNKLFAEDTFTTNGTQNETGTGLGLRICKELIELNKGNIKVESILGKGSTFSISLPKAA